MNRDDEIAIAAITLTETMFDNESDGVHISIEMEGKKIDFIICFALGLLAGSIGGVICIGLVSGGSEDDE